MLVKIFVEEIFLSCSPLSISGRPNAQGIPMAALGFQLSKDSLFPKYLYKKKFPNTIFLPEGFWMPKVAWQSHSQMHPKTYQCEIGG